MGKSLIIPGADFSQNGFPVQQYQKVIWRGDNGESGISGYVNVPDDSPYYAWSCDDVPHGIFESLELYSPQDIPPGFALVQLDITPPQPDGTTTSNISILKEGTFILDQDGKYRYSEELDFSL